MAFEPYKIYCVTWNVNQACPNNIELSELLSKTSDPPDLYVIGLQEIDMKPSTIIKGETSPDYSWIGNLLKGVHPYDSYKELTTVRLVGMMLTIFVKKSIIPSISNVCKSSIGTGKFKLGNKGAVAVSLKLNNTLMCFVNSHFAAGVNDCDKRNFDYCEIMDKIQFNNIFKTRSIIDHGKIWKNTQNS